MNPTVFASFHRVADAQRAISELLRHGVRPEDLNLVAIDPSDDPYGVYAWNPDADCEPDLWAERRQAVSEALIGALKGACVGLVVGFLAALKSLYAPKWGLMLEGGAMATAFDGFLSVIFSGGLVGGLLGYNAYMEQLEEGEAELAPRHVFKCGDTILSVRLDNRTDRSAIQQVLSSHSGAGVDYAGSGAYMS